MGIPLCIINSCAAFSILTTNDRQWIGSHLFSIGAIGAPQAAPTLYRREFSDPVEAADAAPIWLLHHVCVQLETRPFFHVQFVLLML